ncbi:LOW QUALITY PROTEIN: protein phosphatase 1 regulatory subunit 3C, partial [Spinachia spinachia]
ISKNLFTKLCFYPPELASFTTPPSCFCVKHVPVSNPVASPLRVLHAFGSHRQPAVTPVVLTACLGVNQHRPLHRLPAPRHRQHSGLQPPPPSSSPASYSSSPPSNSLRTSEPRSCFRSDVGGGPSKKCVVFADAMELALTVVRLFIPEPSYFASTLARRSSFPRLKSQLLTSDKLDRHRLRLAFPQPAITSQYSLAHWLYPCVQLESCNVSEHSLSGTVRINHVTGDKAAHVRVTFDSWRSHTWQQQPFGGSNEELFGFDLNLPKNINPTERVEFCGLLTPGNGAMLQWDVNRGQNYRLFVETGEANGHQSDAYSCQATVVSTVAFVPVPLRQSSLLNPVNAEFNPIEIKPSQKNRE